MNPHNNFRPVAPAIEKLVHKSFDEPITRDEVLKIQEALAASPAARAWYTELAELHANLAVGQQSQEFCRQVQKEFVDPFEAKPHGLAPTVYDNRTRRARIRSLKARLPLGLAASLLVLGLGLGCGVGLFAATLVYVAPRYVATPWNWKVGNDVVAKVVSTHRVEWQSSLSPETLPTQGLREGQRIRIAEGMLQLRYRSGVRLMLLGPAVYEVRSENGGKLYAGRISAVSPTTASTFNLQTLVGRLQFGAGHFGVEVVDADSAKPQTIVHVLPDTRGADINAQFVDSTDQRISLAAGDAMRFSYDAPSEAVSLASINEFPMDMPSVPGSPFRSTVIHLGNLFDDSKTATLTEAMKTDAFMAAGETIDLGIAAVHDGGLDVDVPLAEDGVLFDFSNVGGGGAKVNGLPGNDTYRSVSSVPIRTTGEDFNGAGPGKKIEEGVGMSANELMTFDLDELRAAGSLGRTAMRFVVDRAGINDREDPLLDSRKTADAHLVVLVSSSNRIISAHVSGEEFGVQERDGIFSIDTVSRPLPPPLRYDGRFVAFDVPIPPDARFLTIAATMVDVEHHDHAVFSGARLELASE